MIKLKKIWLCRNSKIWIMMKLKNSNYDKTQNHKLWWNSKTVNCDETQKLKLWLNSNCDKIYYSNCEKLKLKRLKFWWNSITQSVMKLKNSKTQIVMKLKYLNCEETQQITLWQTQTVIKIKTSNCDETQKLELWQN